MIRADIRSMAAYPVPNSDGLIKLDAMENPFPLPDALRLEWAKQLSEVAINRYPDADMLALRSKIAQRDGVAAEQVLLGNGSDEIIQMLLMASDSGACVVPSPSFVMYDVVSHWLKRPVATVTLNADFSLNAEAFLQVCHREKAAIVFLACPNNPTGNMWDVATVEKIASQFSGLVVIDEAYFPFADRHHLALIGKNVLILRTFSKMGLAGLRLGYVLGDAKLIQHLNKVRMPYNINSLSQTSALFLLEHADVFEAQVTTILRERKRVFAVLKEMSGVEVFDSQTNFLLLRVADADKVFQDVLHAGVLIKNMGKHHDLLRHCLR
ncbi:MAG: histidinol-phosphate transaminase, partial [Mariprofundaceae bacterium]|nr:histidinol-phosphate transaminase [Mariprofundaceae bacterium]